MKAVAFTFICIFVNSIVAFDGYFDPKKPVTEFDLILAAQRNKLKTSREILRRSGDDAITKSSYDIAMLKCQQCGQHTRKISQDADIDYELNKFLEHLAGIPGSTISKLYE